MFFPIEAPDGTHVLPTHDDGREACWAMGEESVATLQGAGQLIWKQRKFGATSRWVPYTREYAPDIPTRPYPSIWADLDTTRQTKAHHRVLFADVPTFDTPKPEDLIARILDASSEPGDLVLDSFAGSGTTGAGAHKMGRRWIMVELGEHARTHVAPRLKKVIDGGDPGGITEATGWDGGGGFRFYRLAPSLLALDKWGQWVISREFNAAMLAEAVCKLEGFTYAPSESIPWQHGYSTETDFLYVTTMNLGYDQLQQLSDDVGPDRSLLVMCIAFRGKKDGYPNLTVKKIPRAVLARCEWGRDDYSLGVENLPQAPEKPSQPGLFEASEWNPHVNANAGRLSLRPPQRRALEILDRIVEIAPPSKERDLEGALAAIQSEFPSVTDFERRFPSVCFAIATGVGKTRLMGAFITYLYLAHGMENFFILAPNLTIYDKLTTDFTPGTPKYVFKGISVFATDPPEVITGDTYETRAGTLFDNSDSVKVNVFNISKLNSEVRGGRVPRIKRLSEYIGQSYFEYLAGLPDLVLLMDESHRYRASAGVRAINELNPVLGLELTATPQVETSKGPKRFKNIILDYPLGTAMADGFVKEPAVVTRKDFNASGMSADELERIKLEDGIRLHEQTKVELETYSREHGVAIVKPFILVIARDTTHARELINLVQGDTFFESRYRDKVLQVDSSRTGAQEDQMVARLLRVEDPDESTEIVVHVNMLKEGWDVTNLYTIIPLRAANARTLIEQSIGRGLRLPYGRRTNVGAVDRLSIVAHDRFQELVDEANQPNSTIRLQSVILDGNELVQRSRTVISQPRLATMLGIQPLHVTPSTEVAGSEGPRGFASSEDETVARIAYEVIKRLGGDPAAAPTISSLGRAEMQERIVGDVSEQYRPQRRGLSGIGGDPDVAEIVARTSELVAQQMIDIPTILLVPTEDVQSGFHPFRLVLDAVNYQAPSHELWIQYLRTGGTEVLGLGEVAADASRTEDYLVSALADFDDIAYGRHSDLLYDLATQTVRHLTSYLSEEDARRVVRMHQRELARLMYSQLHEHYWEGVVAYEVKVTRGFVELKPSAYTQSEATKNFRESPADKSNMAKYLFGGFERCLYAVQKFHSEAERILSVILDREALKWFRPASGQFQIHYKSGGRIAEYQPDFVAELDDMVVMLEPKRRSDMNDVDVLAKRDAGVEWCRRATDYAQSHGGKNWAYALFPDTEIATNMTIAALMKRWSKHA